MVQCKWTQIAKLMGPNGSHQSPVDPRWAPFCSYEPCYQGNNTERYGWNQWTPSHNKTLENTNMESFDAHESHELFPSCMELDKSYIWIDVNVYFDKILTEIPNFALTSMSKPLFCAHTSQRKWIKSRKDGKQLRPVCIICTALWSSSYSRVEQDNIDCSALSKQRDGSLGL